MKKISVVIELFIIVMLIAVLAVTVYAGFNGSAENNTRPQKLCSLSSEALRDALNYNDNSDSFRKKYLIAANGGMTSLTTKDDLKDLPYDLLNDGDFGMQIYTPAAQWPCQLSPSAHPRPQVPSLQRSQAPCRSSFRRCADAP